MPVTGHFHKNRPVLPSLKIIVRWNSLHLLGWVRDTPVFSFAPKFSCCGRTGNRFSIGGCHCRNDTPVSKVYHSSSVRTAPPVDEDLGSAAFVHADGPPDRGPEGVQ